MIKPHLKIKHLKGAGRKKRHGPRYILYIVFTGHRLVGCYEIDSTTACLISLYSAHLNSYDHTQDKEILDVVMLEALTELDAENMFEKKV